MLGPTVGLGPSLDQLHAAAVHSNQMKQANDVGGAGDVRDCTNSNDVDDCLLCTVMRGPTQAVYNQSVKTDIVVTAHLPAAATSEIWTTPSSVWPGLDWQGMVCLQSKAL